MRAPVGLLALLVALPLSGCASMQFANKAWMHPQKNIQQREQDLSECRYEASIHGYIPQKTYVHRSMADAIVSGIGRGMEQDARTTDLVVKCMEARGWRLVDMPAYANTGAPSAAPPTPEPVRASVAPVETIADSALSEALSMRSDLLWSDTPKSIVFKFDHEPVPRADFAGSITYEEYVGRVLKWKKEILAQYAK